MPRAGASPSLRPRATLLSCCFLWGFYCPATHSRHQGMASWLQQHVGNRAWMKDGGGGREHMQAPTTILSNPLSPPRWPHLGCSHFTLLTA